MPPDEIRVWGRCGAKPGPGSNGVGGSLEEAGFAEGLLRKWTKVVECGLGAGRPGLGPSMAPAGCCDSGMCLLSPEPIFSSKAGRVSSCREERSGLCTAAVTQEHSFKGTVMTEVGMQAV